MPIQNLLSFLERIKLSNIYRLLYKLTVFSKKNSPIKKLLPICCSSLLKWTISSQFKSKFPLEMPNWPTGDSLFFHLLFTSQASWAIGNHKHTQIYRERGEESTNQALEKWVRIDGPTYILTMVHVNHNSVLKKITIVCGIKRVCCESRLCQMSL